MIPYLMWFVAGVAIIQAIRSFALLQAVRCALIESRRPIRVMARTVSNECRKERAMQAASLRMFLASGRVIGLIVVCISPVAAIWAVSAGLDRPEWFTRWDGRFAFMLGSLSNALFGQRVLRLLGF